MGGGASTATGLARSSSEINVASSLSEIKSAVKTSVDNGGRDSRESFQHDDGKVTRKVDEKISTLKHDGFVDDYSHDDELNFGDYYDCHDDDGDNGDDDNDIANSELYTNLSTSLDMESDDLLFNLLYFSQKDNQSIGNIGTMFNSAVEETVALHSENNSSIKLKPLSDEAFNGLICDVFNSNDDQNGDCLVCRDVVENGAEIIKIPSCLHSFHKDCVSKWFKYQSTCPICRVNVTVETRERDSKGKNVHGCNTICNSDHKIQIEEHKSL